MRHTLTLTMSYDGAPFCGFARQPGQLTVQGSLEEALRLLYRREVETVCAGRTDAGVHARGQVVSFDLTEAEYAARTLPSLKRSLNALIDEAAAVGGIEEMPLGFSARFDAKAREYRYFIHAGQARQPLIEGRVWHLPGALDLEAMRAGSSHLIGEHDFKSFCMAVSAKGKPTNRNIHEITITEELLFGEQVIVIRVVGNAFLHSMVRTIVGTLVAVGQGKKDPHWVAEVLSARDRCAAGENAPAAGLIFWKTLY